MEIRIMSLSLDRAAIDAFYAREGIRLDTSITYLAGVYEDETLLALGGIAGNAIRSLAVSDMSRGEGLLPMLVTHLYQKLRDEGVPNVFVVTKPKYAPLFSSLCFLRTCAHYGRGSAGKPSRRAVLLFRCAAESRSRYHHECRPVHKRASVSCGNRRKTLRSLACTRAVQGCGARPRRRPFSVGAGGLFAPSQRVCCTGW